MPAISIIIPVYNVERYLRRCLDSVLAQTFTDWQAICVNDGSPDNCDKILAEYAAHDKRIVVVNKENGGLSDARNVGMKHATGEYIMFLDSDDFIHPQTMEIAHYMAQRDDTDIVSFRYDRFYRPYLMVRHFLGLNTDDLVPIAMHYKYRPSCVCSLSTNDIFKYATERTHNLFNFHRSWLIKHCQVWKNLYRRGLIADVPFVKGILFEDFPWWSEVMLKNPRVTILKLPLYFYRPNFGGIVLAANQFRIMQSLCRGIEHAFLEYHDKANAYQFSMWNKNFLWFFIARAFDKVQYLEDASDLNAARECFYKLYKIGALDFVPNKKMYKLRDKIWRFVRE